MTTTETASRPLLFQPPTSTNTNVKDTSMQPPPPQPETMEKKNKGALPSTPALTQPTTATNNSDEGTSTQPPLLQQTKPLATHHRMIQCREQQMVTTR
jgi:hypothetical protein